MIFGLLTALAFAATPLERARALPATTLLRETAVGDIGPLGRRGRLAAALSAAALFGFALVVGADKRLTAEFGAAVLISFALLYGVARAIMAWARRAPHSRNLSLRLAVANLHRPGALTPSFLISLGLGVTLLTALVGVERNLRAEIGGSVPKQAPSFFFFDIQAAQAAAFEAFLRKEAPNGDRGRRAHAARAHRRGERDSRRAGQGRGQGALGAGGRPRASLFRDARPTGRASSRANGGRRIMQARRWSRWKPALRRASA